MRLSAPVPHLKRQARLLSRKEGIPLHHALDRIAAAEGFASWSLLAARHAPQAGAGNGAAAAFTRLVPGDLLLLAARPGQGKTLMGLRLAVEAMKAGRAGAFFSLEYTERDILDRFRAIGVDPSAFADRFTFDCSDGICAGYIMERLADAPAGMLAVIDYLQLLDQRRDTPPLAQQVAALAAFARRRGLVLVFLSQVDRRYDAAARACPGLDDIRLPNPVDLSLFGKACFLDGGEMRFQALA